MDYGTALMHRTAARSGTLLSVIDSKYFSDGYTMSSGDSIRVAGMELQILSIPNSNSIIVSQNTSGTTGSVRMNSI